MTSETRLKIAYQLIEKLAQGSGFAPPSIPRMYSGGASRMRGRGATTVTPSTSGGTTGQTSGRMQATQTSIPRSTPRKPTASGN